MPTVTIAGLQLRWTLGDATDPEFRFNLDGSGRLFDGEGDPDGIDFIYEFASPIATYLSTQEIADDDERLLIEGDAAYVCVDTEDLDTELASVINNFFWDELNEQLQDPLLTDDNLSSEDFRVAVSYTVAQFDALMQAAVLAWLMIHPTDRNWMVSSDPDDESSTPPEAMTALFGAIIGLFEPSGVEWEYNDGPTGRQSGYNRNNVTHDFDATEIYQQASPRERLGARRRLIELLEPLPIDGTALCPELGLHNAAA